MIYAEFFRNNITHAKNILVFLVFTFVFISCLKVYEPVIIGSDLNKLVVSGLVTDRNQAQVLTISMASSINLPKMIVVTGCKVTISDDKGHQFPLVDSANGNYYGLIDPQYLIPGSLFMVEILTPDGDRIISDFDKFGSSPEVDSIYYIRKDLPTNDPGKVEKGIQLYIDLNGEIADSKFYRFEAIESWEYHSEYPVTFYYSYGDHYVYPPDYSLNVCWSTFVTRDIYVLSTEYVAGNKYKQFPLQFINNRTQKLAHGYSLLVNQYALSEAAYKYWNQLRINSTIEGGLYEKQPLATNGNLRNITNPEQEVLGFFGASSVKSGRIFIKKVENLELELESTCAFRYVTWDELISSNESSWPLYLEGIDYSKPIKLYSNGCVDCRDLHGTIVKPDFWPN